MVSKEIVWILQFQSIIWFTIIFVPYLSIAAPVILYLHFKFVKMRLTKWKIQPEQSSNDETIGYFIMVFMNFTFLLNVGAVGYLMFNKVEHSYFVDVRDIILA